MNRFGLLLTTLAACTYSTGDDLAHFHGTVGGSVTHVMAVSPVAGELQKVLAPTEGGAFDLAVEPGRPWTLVFIDGTRKGSEMVTGVLRSDSLDTFLPRHAGDIDLGFISIDNREATMAGSSETLDAALGLSRRTLATIGGVDDIAVRYANPDIDGDGIIDITQGRAARLEMHLEYALVAPDGAATANDFLARSASVGYEHVGTGIYGRLPDSFGAVDRDHASVTFDQPFYGTHAGPFTAAIPAGTPITQLTFGDNRTFGVFARPDQACPWGNYRFQSGKHTLDFSLVRMPTEMTMDQVMPRVHFVPAVAGCVSNCEISAVGFQWERRTDKGWIVLTDEEAQALQPRGSLDLLAGDGSHRRFEFPLDVPAGSVPFHLDLYRSTSMSTGDITYMNIAFQTRQGLKMFASLGDGHIDNAHQFGMPAIGSTD
jgi:hypothetical protein